MDYIIQLVPVGTGLRPNDGTGDSLRKGGQVLNGNFDAVRVAVNGLAMSQSAGMLSYMTKQAMDADLAWREGILAMVTNDPVPDNNRTWRKLGAAGAGSWSVTFDRLWNALGNTGGYQAPGTGAVLRNVQAKLRDFGLPTVEDYGAIGDGATDDSAAFLRMHAALGYIRAQRKTYYLGSVAFGLQASSVTILGAGKPSPNAAETTLVDGTGTILVGTLQLRASYFVLRDFGVDVGDQRFGGAEREGFVADALEGQNGIDSVVENVASMGPTAAQASHALLQEGFDKHRITNVDVYNHNYGVVSKSRNGTIERIRGSNIKTAVVYPKSSVPAKGGNVLSAMVDNIRIHDVSGRGSAPTALAVWVHAEGVAATRVKFSKVSMVGGRAAFRIQADAGQYVSNVQHADITADGCVLGWELAGPTFDVRGRGYVISNPSTGQAFQVDAAATNWLAVDIVLDITQAGITGTSPAAMLGSGMWDNLTVRNNNLSRMYMTYDTSAVRGGRVSGNVGFLGDGLLTLGPGVTAAAGEVAPRIAMGHDNTLYCTGVANPSAAGSSTTLATLPAPFTFGPSRYLTAVARKIDNTYTTAYLSCSGQKLALLSPAPSAINQVDLSSVLIRIG